MFSVWGDEKGAFYKELHCIDSTIIVTTISIIMFIIAVIVAMIPVRKPKGARTSSTRRHADH